MSHQTCDLKQVWNTGGCCKNTESAGGRTRLIAVTDRGREQSFFVYLEYWDTKNAY